MRWLSLTILWLKFSSQYVANICRNSTCPQTAFGLPLHDALILGLIFMPARDGFITVTLDLAMNPEEPVDALRELGVVSSTFRLVFENCWQAKANVLGCTAGQESLSGFDIDQESALISTLRTAGLGSRNMTHFRIVGSSGSQLGFVAESISIFPQPRMNQTDEA